MGLSIGALRLSLLYTLVAGLWVLLSDGWLAQLGLPPKEIERLQLFKGLGFVVLSALLLYLVLRTHAHLQARSQHALSNSEKRLSLALESAESGLWDWDLRAHSVYFSPRYASMLGLEPNDLGPHPQDWLERLHPDDRQRYETLFAAAISAPQTTMHENLFRLRHRDDSYRWIQTRGRVQFDSAGKPRRFIGTASDVTQRRADEDSLRQAAAVFEVTQEGVLVTDAQHRIVHINPAFSRITGYSEAQILGQDPSVLKSGRHDAAFYANIWQMLRNQGGWSGEIWNRRRNGEVYPQWQCIRAIHDENGAILHYVAVFSDITALKRSQRELDYLAHNDPLTNLPNRLLFTERVEHALERGRREGLSGAVLLIDLDHFKHVNESLGHNIGDLLLKAVGERLKALLDTRMTLARLGGDEFGLLCETGLQAEQTTDLAQRVLDSFHAPFNVVGQELFITASLGIGLFNDDAQSAEQILRNVDSALFKAKNSGRETFAFYAQELTEHARQRVQLVSALRHALDLQQLRVHYQPLIDLADGRMVGVEALVRWQHPQRGLVPPGEFIPIAEESGLISAIDTWVLQQACEQMVAWQQAGSSLQFVAVNVSSRLFCRDLLDHQVAQVLEQTGLAPACLELEVTESAVMVDPDAAQGLLERLRNLGVHLAIDDFGTGYSSLARLKRLPVHKLKLDQSFVRGLPHDEDDVAISRAVIALGHSLKLKVLAEGIEHPDQAAFLKALGCDYGQGYHFGRPAAQLPGEA